MRVFKGWESWLDGWGGDVLQVRLMLGIFRIVRTLLLTFALMAGFSSSASAGEHPTIRVALMKGVPRVVVRSARGTLTARDSEGLMRLSGRSMTISASNGVLRLDGSPFPGGSITIEGKPALYRIDNATYRGLLTIYADGDTGVMVVNVLDIEDYLAGVINSEISSNWPIEAVKAQAIAARTYALSQMKGMSQPVCDAHYDVESTIVDQVYHGAHREDKRAYEGVRATTGLVLTRGGLIFPSFYHSTCGGMTEYARNVWDQAASSSPTVDPYCRHSPNSAWFVRIPRVEFISMLTKAGILKPETLLMGIEQTKLVDSPRADEVQLITDAGEMRIKATALRELIGYQRLKSTWFNVGIEGDEVVFAGRGFGHGVGLCQWGAKGMAEAGKNYRDILKQYYSDAEIGRMY